MYYLIKSISGIFVTKMDKQEILSEIQKIESGLSIYSYGNTKLDSQRRLQFINDVLNFLDTAFTKELYHVETWKEKIRKSLQTENIIFGYSGTQTEASNVLFQVKNLLIRENTIPFNSLPTCRPEASVPTPHENNTEQKQEGNTEKILNHAASAILHAGMFLYAQHTYNFYNEIVANFESEQRILHRQLTPYENQLLSWAREERDHAQHARNKDGFKAAIHGVESIVGAAGELRRY